MNKTIRIIGTGALLLLWAALTLFAWFGPAKALSEAERRPLAQIPELSVEKLLDGSFMEKFETYTLDQFPLRDSFRTLKSLFSYHAFRQTDNNGIYLQDGYAAKLEYPLQQASVRNALKRFQFLYENYLQDTSSRIFMTVIPDKGYYLAEKNGYPAMDYQTLFREMEKGMPWAQTVDITGSLDITDYYYTDTHWRQEKLLETAQVLCRALGVTVPQKEMFTPTLASQSFYGVYYGQAALPMKPEELYLMKSSLLDACRVYNHETKSYQSIYDLAKLTGPDQYEVYLSGAQALLTVENPNAATDKELIVFRDSFGSSLVPLLVQDYRSVTLVDIRYVRSSVLEQYLTFHGQDVLFAYSTLVLNSSTSLK